MLIKRPKKGLDLWIPRLKKIGLGVVVIEVGFVLTGFFFIKKISRDQESRLRIRQYWPSLIETYYSYLLRIDQSNSIVREQDDSVLRSRGLLD